MLEQLQPGLLGRRGERLPLLAGVGLFVVALVVVLTASLRDPRSLDAMAEEAAPSASQTPSDGSDKPAGPGHSSDAVTPTPVEAPSAVLDRTINAADLEKLSATYPKDAKVERKLLLAYSDDQRALPQAVPVALRLLGLEPNAASDDAVRRIILRGASGPPSVSDLAFQAMQSQMGSSGPDLLWELSEGGTAVATAVKDRAQKALVDPKVRDLMTPALRVACDLKALPACQRKSLLPVAEKDADKRSLPLLDQLVGTRGCGLLHLSSCYTCPGSPAQGLQTIATIKARSKP